MHQIGFSKCRRQKVRSARLQLRGVIGVLAEVIVAARDQQLLELRIVHRVRVIEREREAERRVRMKAGANRIDLLRQEIEIPRRQRIGERLQVRRPRFRLGVDDSMQFLGELQRPRPAIRALERLGVGPIEVRGFNRDVLRRQVFVERLLDLRRLPAATGTAAAAAPASSGRARMNASRNNRRTQDALSPAAARRRACRGSSPADSGTSSGRTSA